MDLIERYIHEVGQNLPRKTRADIQAELRSLLMDKLEERAAAAGRAPDEEMAVELLRGFGDPAKVAEHYAPEPQYLIGPRLFPAFKVTVRIMLWFLLAFILFATAITALSSGQGARELLEWRTLGSLLWEFERLALFNLGILVLVFAVLDRVLKPATSKTAPWDPRTLPAIEDPDRISPGELVFKSYGIVTLAAVLNFYPNWFGLFFFSTGGIVASVSVFDLGFPIPALLIDLWWALALALNVSLLRRGRWTPKMRWAQFALGVFGAVILRLILSGSTFGQFSPEWLARRGWIEPLELPEFVGGALQWLIRQSLWLALAITLIASVVRFYRLLTRYAPWSSAASRPTMGFSA